jgi:hypothetical protein
MKLDDNDFDVIRIMRTAEFVNTGRTEFPCDDRDSIKRRWQEAVVWSLIAIGKMKKGQ